MLDLTPITETEIKKYDLDETKIQFLQYTMLPKALRPHRQYICAKLGIPDYRYYIWLRDPQMNEARRELVKQYYKDDVPDILMAMKNEALAGNERAARLFLEYVEDFNKHEERLSPFQPPEMIPVKEVNIIINNLEQKFYGNNQPREDQRPVATAGSGV